MDETNTRWCSAPGCMLNIKIMKRHFFRFPKDRKRYFSYQTNVDYKFEDFCFLLLNIYIFFIN